MSESDGSAAPPSGKGTPGSAGNTLPKRFYSRAEATEAGEGEFRVELDGRPVRTPGRTLLSMPSAALAERVAAEWAAQGERIDPVTMPVTRLVNSAIDGVAPRRAEVAGEIVRYAGSDLLCYRADTPEQLVTLQRELWDPLLAWAREDIGVSFFLSQGILYVEQPPRTLEVIAALLPEEPIRLAALNLMTVLSGSALVALAVWKGRLTAEEGWRVAHIDEEAQEQFWGLDAEAAERRASRFRDFAAAAFSLEALG